ncbi:MAG: two-component regulator propeller domain-containing protein [Gemmatimonadota bacterium]
MPYRPARVSANLVATLAAALLTATAHGEPPAPADSGDGLTLARATFWVAPERVSELGAAAAAVLGPLLEARGLRPYAGVGRPVPDSVYSQLYEVGSPAALAAAREHLDGDPALLQARRALSRQFGTWPEYIRAALRLYRAPAGPGTTRVAGPGRRIPLGPGRGHLQTFDVTDGLAGPMVLSIYQDRTGRMWFGTYNNGVSCFDGQKWTKYDTSDGLAHNQVRGIYGDGGDGLWLLTSGGLTHYDGSTWRSYTAAEGAPTQHLYGLAVAPGGDLWVATVGRGLVQYTGGRWVDHGLDEGLPDDRLLGVMLDRQGRLWVSTLAGVARRDPGGWTLITTQDGLADNVVYHMLQDRAGNYWFATEEKGLSRFDGTAWTTLAEPGRLSAYGNLFEDRDGSLWVPTDGAGVARYRDGAWSFLTTDDGLAHNIVFCAAEDGEGQVWIGSTGGVSRYDDHSLTVYTAADGLPAPGVRHAYVTRSGQLWLAHGDWSRGRGIGRLDGRTLTYYTAADGLPNDDVHSLYEDRDGSLWLTTAEGVTRYDGRTFYSLGEPDGLPVKGVSAVLQDRGGTYWFGTRNGLARYDGHTVETYGNEDGLAASHILSLFEDSRGALWVGTVMGLSRRDGDHFTSWGRVEGLTNGEVFDVTEAPDGSLWLATHGGIFRFDGQTFTNYTTASGLTSNDVHDVTFDADGVLWIGTDGGGVGHFDGQVFQSLTRGDGLPSNVTMFSTQDPAGDLWFSSNVGLVRHRPQHTPTYPVTIEAVVADRRYPGSAAVEVPSNVEVVAFEFRGISLKTRPQQLVYRYRLRGHDDAWRQTRDNRVEYDGLGRGDYVFEVVSVDRDLNYSESAAAVPLRVTFPYERLAWFLALDVAIVLVILQAVRVMRRDRRLQDSNAALVEQTAALERAHQQVLEASQAKSAFLANVSHELRTPMNAIINFSSLILEEVYGGISADLRDAVEEIDRNGGNLLALINDVLDLSKIEAGAMELQLGECAPEACIDVAVEALRHQAAAKGLALVREVDGELPALWADERRLTQHVLLNLVRNAIKFTARGEVRVGAAAQNGEVRFWVTDTGPGIPPREQERIFEPFYQVDASASRQTEGTGLGLAIVRRFVEMHGGRVWLRSAPGQGSTFQFTIPVQSRP